MGVLLNDFTNLEKTIKKNSNLSIILGNSLRKRLDELSHYKKLHSKTRIATTEDELISRRRITDIGDKIETRRVKEKNLNLESRLLNDTTNFIKATSTPVKVKEVKVM